MSLDLSGRTVVVTGASGGLGRALAPALRARSANLALLDLDLQAVTEMAQGLGGERAARGWAADVRDLAGLEATMGEVAAHFGRIDVVIAAAGVGELMAPALTTDPGAWERIIDINVNGVWRTFRAALPHVERQRGHLVAISSMAAFIHNPLHGPYAPSKAAVWALCDTLRLELAPKGVTVGSVHPTFFATPMVTQLYEDPAAMRLWNGFKGLWKLTSIDSVVADVIRSVERRSAHVTSPRNLRWMAWMPGIAQALIERIGYRRGAVREATALAERDAQ